MMVGKFLAALIVGTILAAGFFSVMSTTKAYSIGSDDADWWIEYPDQHSDSGSEVKHPEWVLEDLEDGPIILLIHRGGCPACIKQESDINNVLKEMGNKITYDDLLTDGKSADIANEAIVTYDPHGDPRYVPVTVLMTLVPDSNGSVQVGWHSYVGYGGESPIRSYVKDAIDFYEDNSDRWNNETRDE